MSITIGSSGEYSTHLVIPDEHYFHGDNFRRCEALGKFIVDTKPKVIIRLGDIWDMPSLCFFDKGKKEMVFKNVRNDIEAGHKAEKILFTPLLEYNKQQVKNKKAKYQPLILKLLGNHEDRVQKLLDYEPQWEGSISMDDFKTRLNLKETIVPFKDFAQVDGIFYSHLWSSGVMGRPFSSARAMIGKRGVSCTMGHSHTLDFSISVKPNGEMIRGLIAGCFQDPDHKGFGGTQVDMLYWNGVFLKHNVKNGSYDLEEISTKRLLEVYGVK